MIRNLAMALGVGLFLIAGTVHAGVDPVALCKEKKLKSTGKEAFDLLKSFPHNTQPPEGAKLASGISKAESKGACLTSGDSGDIQVKVDAFTLDVLCELDPDCSPSGAFLDASHGTLD